MELSKPVPFWPTILLHSWNMFVLLVTLAVDQVLLTYMAFNPVQ